jgi:hypothetical protein
MGNLLFYEYFSFDFLFFTNRTKMVSGQRLEWTKVRTEENTHCAANFNKTNNPCENPFEGSDQ